MEFEKHIFPQLERSREAGAANKLILALVGVGFKNKRFMKQLMHYARVRAGLAIAVTALRNVVRPSADFLKAPHPSYAAILVPWVIEHQAKVLNVTELA